MYLEVHTHQALPLHLTPMRLTAMSLPQLRIACRVVSLWKQQRQRNLGGFYFQPWKDLLTGMVQTFIAQAVPAAKIPRSQCF